MREQDLKFRLTYQGQLLSETNRGKLLDARARHKHEIRKSLHPQLKRLWEISPNLLLKPLELPAGTKGVRFGAPKDQHTAKGLSEIFTLGNYNFVPLLTRGMGAICKIDVLYLRAGAPGSAFSSGDIDNRLKTLFDGLTVPREEAQLGG